MYACSSNDSGLRTRVSTVIRAILLVGTSGIALVCLCSLSPGSNVLAQERSKEKPRLPVIEAGTVVGQADAKRWNRIILIAQPRIASGDVDALSKSIRDTVSSFDLTILATVEKVADPTGQPRYRLREVGAGYSKDIEGTTRIITSDSQRRLGANLGFFARQMLKTNEGQLASARLIAKSDTTFVFDTPTLILRNGAHTEMVTRHFIWVDPRAGTCSTLVWLLDISRGVATVYDEAMRWFPQDVKEDRRVHVDGDQFLLGGIPTDKAFALEDLPPGKKMKWTQRAKRTAALGTYDKTSFQELALALNECLQAKQ